ncbi:hypothetical protein E4U48_004841 [Claviceps purpurea]|nr:hypothetical protein E4U48_004841 [Claviceps purpurea]
MAEIKKHERNRQSAGTPPMRRPQEPRLRTPQLFDRLQPECPYLQSALPVYLQRLGLSEISRYLRPTPLDARGVSCETSSPSFQKRASERPRLQTKQKSRASYTTRSLSGDARHQ